MLDLNQPVVLVPDPKPQHYVFYWKWYTNWNLGDETTHPAVETNSRERDLYLTYIIQLFLPSCQGIWAGFLLWGGNNSPSLFPGRKIPTSQNISYLRIWTSKNSNRLAGHFQSGWYSTWPENNFFWLQTCLVPRTNPNPPWGLVDPFCQALLTKNLGIFGPKLVSCPDPISLQMQFRSGHTDAIRVLNGVILTEWVYVCWGSLWLWVHCWQPDHELAPSQ